MANLDECRESMTIYYSKNTGVIRMCNSGVQDMSVYGDLQSDMEQIQDFLVLPKDDIVLNNPKLYKIDIENKVLYKALTTEEDIRIRALEEENLNLKLAMAELFEMMLGGEA